jgi:hypothetical protein
MGAAVVLSSEPATAVATVLLDMLNALLVAAPESAEVTGCLAMVRSA